MTESVTRILIVDAHPIVREGLRVCLDKSSCHKVVAEAGDGYAALLAVKTHFPDVIILDVGLTKIDIFEAIRRLRQLSPDLKFLICYLAEDPLSVQELIQAGVSGFIGKNAEPTEFTNAVQAIAGGGNYFSNSLIGEMFNGKPMSVHGVNLYGLTQRESEILRYLAEGMSNKEIANRLCRSVRTVETHRLSIRRKTNAYNLSDLVKIARKLGFSDPQTSSKKQQDSSIIQSDQEALQTLLKPTG